MGEGELERVPARDNRRKIPWSSEIELDREGNKSGKAEALPPESPLAQVGIYTGGAGFCDKRAQRRTQDFIAEVVSETRFQGSRPSVDECR